MKNNLTIKIKGKEWQIRFVTSKQYHKQHSDRNEEEAALTNSLSRTIDFIKEAINLRIVRHELMHAHFAECATGDSDLSNEQIEEQACNLIGEHLDEFIMLTNKIIDFYLMEVK